MAAIEGQDLQTVPRPGQHPVLEQLELRLPPALHPVIPIGHHHEQVDVTAHGAVMAREGAEERGVLGRGNQGGDSAGEPCPQLASDRDGRQHRGGQQVLAAHRSHAFSQRQVSRGIPDLAPSVVAKQADCSVGPITVSPAEL
ncbi:hypothetical protein KRR39_10825 [Nocardioides panacis]|uniref:Uncharacterized protein n=1 Tax=Nocardioides panacis TaxID=2849501 RepID=A0A975T2G8_9ACTN|nr:hypothetical protein [Nocardioides panacis]QWZ10182.1 hypothetical protein KRR39_10825 [Nocardioides panacis]